MSYIIELYSIKKKLMQVSKRQLDSYGSPRAPTIDSYGVPEAPVQTSSCDLQVIVS